jgi:hypothetical protein
MLVELVESSPFYEKFNTYSRLKIKKHNFNGFLFVNELAFSFTGTRKATFWHRTPGKKFSYRQFIFTE